MSNENDELPAEAKALIQATIDLLKAMTRWFDRKDVKGTL